jgi:hypothetical protein
MNPIKTEPMIIEMPGIPGKLRSQSLDEYMSALIPEHPARAELAQLRAMALEGMKMVSALAEAMTKIQSLQEQLSQNTAPTPGTATGAAPKVACPECGKLITATPGPWASHQKVKHGKSGVQIPL